MKFEASTAPHGKLLTFDHAEIRTSQYNGDLFLYVEGEDLKMGWDDVLTPQINQKQPEYLTVEILQIRAPTQQSI